MYNLSFYTLGIFRQRDFSLWDYPSWGIFCWRFFQPTPKNHPKPRKPSRQIFLSASHSFPINFFVPTLKWNLSLLEDLNAISQHGGGWESFLWANKMKDNESCKRTTISKYIRCNPSMIYEFLSTFADNLRTLASVPNMICGIQSFVPGIFRICRWLSEFGDCLQVRQVKLM